MKSSSDCGVEVGEALIALLDVAELQPEIKARPATAIRAVMVI
jgi:hypothetical protein